MARRSSSRWSPIRSAASATIFTGMVGFTADHPDRARVDKLTEEQVGYVLAFVRDDGTTVDEGTAYTISDRPKAMARKLGT